MVENQVTQVTKSNLALKKKKKLYFIETNFTKWILSCTYDILTAKKKREMRYKDQLKKTNRKGKLTQKHEYLDTT